MVGVAEQKVSIELTIEQWSFICSGLRDLAAALMPRIDNAETQELEFDYRNIRIENLRLANIIEKAYVS